MLNEEEVNKVFNRLKNHPSLLESIKELLYAFELLLMYSYTS
ncbi:hypothetical protein [Neochlamydia sp. AcF95]|nr:hypothetical protein [Neochlamydia sp. AcF95]MBS4171179.1 hypothetical protein [Neochlamydia sp. AcF95]